MARKQLSPRSVFRAGPWTPAVVLIAASGIHASAHPPLATSDVGAAETAASLPDADPHEYMQAALARCARTIKDYHFMLTKRERFNGKLGPREIIRVAIDERPKRILMIWIRNADRAHRALYLAGEHNDWLGRELFEVVPSGDIARAVMGTVRVPVHCPDRAAQGLGNIDELGFHSMLRQILDCNAAAAAHGDLKLQWRGEGEIDGRPTWVVDRVIRQPERIGPKAAARMYVHLDKQWQLPVSVQCYADPHGRRLSRSYVFTSIELNPGLRASQFALSAPNHSAQRALLAERR